MGWNCQGLMIFNLTVALFIFRSNIHARNLENIKKHKGPNKQTKPELIPPFRDNLTIFACMLRISCLWTYLLLCISFLECELYLTAHTVLQAVGKFSLSFYCSVHSIFPTLPHCPVSGRLNAVDGPGSPRGLFVHWQGTTALLKMTRLCWFVHIFAYIFFPSIRGF